jgi:ABC-type branched-subunit amino acid transport system ATPase component
MLYAMKLRTYYAIMNKWILKKRIPKRSILQSLRKTSQKTILLVEDEAIIALAESACLKRKGYSDLTAPSG